MVQLNWNRVKTLRRPRWLEFARESTRQERATQRQSTHTLNICRGSSGVVSWILISTCMWGNYSRPRFKPWQSIPQIHTTMIIVYVSNSQSGEISKNWNILFSNIRKILISVGNQISSRLKATLISPNEAWK